MGAVVVYAGERGEGQDEKFAAAAAKIQEVTGKAKIRLALNAVCGLSGELLAKCLAPSSTILTYGVMGREPMSVAGGQLLFKQITYAGFHLGGWSRAHPEEQDPMWDFLIKHVADGSMQFPAI